MNLLQAKYYWIFSFRRMTNFKKADHARTMPSIRGKKSPHREVTLQGHHLCSSNSWLYHSVILRSVCIVCVSVDTVFSRCRSGCCSTSKWLDQVLLFCFLSLSGAFEVPPLRQHEAKVSACWRWPTLGLLFCWPPGPHTPGAAVTPATAPLEERRGVLKPIWVSPLTSRLRSILMSWCSSNI